MRGFPSVESLPRPADLTPLEYVNAPTTGPFPPHDALLSVLWLHGVYRLPALWLSEGSGEEGGFELIGPIATGEFVSRPPLTAGNADRVTAHASNQFSQLVELVCCHLLSICRIASRRHESKLCIRLASSSVQIPRSNDSTVSSSNVTMYSVSPVGMYTASSLTTACGSGRGGRFAMSKTVFLRPGAAYLLLFSRLGCSLLRHTRRAARPR